MKKFAWEHWVGLLGLALLLVGSSVGLVVVPSERFMGEVQRILYVHVPSAWTSMACYSAAFVAAIVSLWTGRRRWDAALVGMIETGMVFNALLLCQGMLWGKPTWGYWWDWDVRLTTSLVMLLLFTGVLALRSFVEDADQRASWSAIAAIVSYVDVPLVFLCVRWWRSLHQSQSSPETVDPLIGFPWLTNAIALPLVAVWLIARRARLELLRRQHDEVGEPERRELIHD